jgi:hypothetical protein
MYVMVDLDLFDKLVLYLLIVVHFVFVEKILLVVDSPNVFDKDDQMIDVDLDLMDIQIPDVYYILM